MIIALLILTSCKSQNNFQQIDYRIITKDLDNFWLAYDALENSLDSVATIQRLYIAKATPEFQKFLELRNFTAKQYVDWIKHKPKFWKTVRPLTLAVKDKRPNIDTVYQNMLNMYPDFIAPDINFAISPIQTGGTTDRGLILIGTEIAVVNQEKVDISEIDGFMGEVFKHSIGDIMSLVTHELIHTQQPSGDNENESLLSQAITEGAADFVATLLLGKQSMNKAIFDYGEKNQKELWREFRADIQGRKRFEETDWFYNYNSDRPADLGYYLGYKIVESYYNNADDKKQAIAEIIEMDNAMEFLEKSNYSP